jgi:holin-like protein
MSKTLTLVVGSAKSVASSGERGKTANPPSEAQRRHALRRFLIISSQLGALIAISKTGCLVARALHLPLPGNLVGMLFLFALLRSGLIPQAWIEETSSILTRHLSFFFIPIAVGLMGYSRLLVDNGVAIIGTLVSSAAIGICASGFLAQALVRWRQGMKGREPSLTLRKEGR